MVQVLLYKPRRCFIEANLALGEHSNTFVYAVDIDRLEQPSPKKHKPIDLGGHCIEKLSIRLQGQETAR